MISKLIVNADDLGLTSSVSRAIVEAHQNGIVTSTTILGNCDNLLLEQAEEIARKNPKLGIGAHLVLTTREPVLKTHLTLVDGLGKFRFKHAEFDGVIDEEEVYQEWKAQLQRLTSVLSITHIDSHHHVHMRPEFQGVAKRLSKEFKLPMRWNKARKYSCVYSVLSFYADNATVEHLEEIIQSHHGLVEIMVHPGYDNDDFLEEISSYCKERQTELDVLTSERIREHLNVNNVELVNYRFVKKK